MIDEETREVKKKRMKNKKAFVGEDNNDDLTEGTSGKTRVRRKRKIEPMLRKREKQEKIW